MLTLISTIFGFFSPFLTELLKHFQDKRDKVHELNLMKQQAESAEKLAIYETQQQRMASDEKIITSINDYAAKATKPTGNSFVDTLTGSVRPVITYGFFLFYIAVKIAQFFLIVSGGDMPWLQINYAEAVVKLWSEEDSLLFSYLIGFWFGERNIRRAKNA